MLTPKDILETLEFDKIIQLTQNYCMGELAATQIAEIQIQTEPHIIERLLLESEEMQKTYAENHQFPLSAYVDLSADYQKLVIEGYTLTLETLQMIRQQLLITQGIFNFFGYGKKRDILQLYPTLYGILSKIDFQTKLADAISRVLDENGDMRPDASPDLMRLVRLQNSKRQELDKRFRQVAQFYNSKGWLADIVESMRNGRRVLAVLAEYKRQLRGIMHDESATGRTAFIEPEEVIDLNNDLFDLEQEYKREVYRILRDLSSELRPYAATMQLYQDLIVRYDIIAAKAQLSYNYQGIKPKLFTQPHFKLTEARHPLLYLKNLKTKQKTRPFDLNFRPEQRILLLSGPNAGGKSICMKAIGLIQLMVQAGFLIPAEEGSELGVFQQFMADIGDQQSLEDELSTYSSRLKNAREFLEKANPQTMVLIDEFGSGTDPQMGGAIAEAILSQLNQAKVWGVVTTHYSNLKVFANKNKGIVNGAMVFDKKTLSPTYEMRIGIAGSSYAFEIAEKSGLPAKVIQYAQREIGQETVDMDAMLVELQQEKQKLNEANSQLAAQQKQLDALIKNYEYAARELEFGRKKLKLQTKEQELQEMQKLHTEALKTLEQALLEVKNAKEAEKKSELAKQALKLSEQTKQTAQTNLNTLKEDIYKVYAPTLAEIKAGTYVKLRDGNTFGMVTDIRKKEATVQVGNMLLTLPLRDLQAIDNPIIKTEDLRPKNDVTKKVNFNPQVDIRGLKYEEAIDAVQDFIDNALLSDAYLLRIIHGKGGGILRRAVWDKLKLYPKFRNVRFAPDNQGGEGVTEVEM